MKDVKGIRGRRVRENYLGLSDVSRNDHTLSWPSASLAAGSCQQPHSSTSVTSPDGSIQRTKTDRCGACAAIPAATTVCGVGLNLPATYHPSIILRSDYFSRPLRVRIGISRDFSAHGLSMTIGLGLKAWGCSRNRLSPDPNPHKLIACFTMAAGNDIHRLHLLRCKKSENTGSATQNPLRRCPKGMMRDVLHWLP